MCRVETGSNHYMPRGSTQAAPSLEFGLFLETVAVGTAVRIAVGSVPLAWLLDLPLDCRPTAKPSD